MPQCSHCQKIQQLQLEKEILNKTKSLLHEKEKELTDTPTEQKSHYKWRNDWDKSKREILKNEKSLKEIAEKEAKLLNHACLEKNVDWDVETPREEKHFDFDFESDSETSDDYLPDIETVINKINLLKNQFAVKEQENNCYDYWCQKIATLKSRERERERAKI